MSSKKFFTRTLVLITGILIAMGLFIFIWDPCNYYRIVDNKLKYVASAYITAGVIRNADYDAVIIGSSLSQNFNPQLFRDLLGENVLKANTGGISLEQRNLFYRAAEQNGKADKYYIEILLSSFNSEDDPLDDTPVYLYDENILNDYQYLYGYDTWLRAVPISLAYKILDICNINISTMDNLQSVDNIGIWYNRYQVGADVVEQKYFSNMDAVSAQNLDGMYERMIENVDKKLTSVIDSDNSYVFYFPPYSALFWADSENKGYYDQYLAVKEYIILKLCEYPNVEVYDFQYADCILDLNNYRDTTHYSREINDWMVECFASGKYRVEREDLTSNITILKQLVESFQESHKDWFCE